jgi:polar amino acid transport system substrate-binding protein
MVTTPNRIKIAIAFIACALLVGMQGLLFMREPSLDEAFPEKSIIFAIDPSYIPFAMDNGRELYGIDVDIARAIGEELGIAVHFNAIGYDGLYDALLSNRVNAIISALPVNPHRTADVRYTRPYFDNGLLLVSQADVPILAPEQLAGKQLAVEYGSIGNSFALDWQRRINPFTIQPYELPEYALDALRFRRSDVAIVDYTSYRLYAAQFSDWTPVTSYITSTPYVIAVRFDDYANWFWIEKALNRLQENGTIQRIIDHWMQQGN